MNKVPLKTETLWRRAEAILASGLFSLTQGAHHYPKGLFPLLASSGKGCRIVDTDGQSFIDWIMGFGAVILGYRNQEVEDAIVEQLRESGPLLSLSHPIEIETARIIREVVPSAEAVAFGKNGSDALAISVRLARAVTGRRGVLFHGYHGIHDWYMAAQPHCEGIPEELRQLTAPFPFNDAEALERIFEDHPHEIACVVMEPFRKELPESGYLKKVRDLTLNHGALLIFDEVLTSFRVGIGGAQACYDVFPDITCLGKSMANGMPLSAATGPREIFEAMPRVGYGLTFRGETLSLRAASTCIRILQRDDVATHLAQVGQELRQGFRDLCQSRSVSADLVGHPSNLALSFESVASIEPMDLQTLTIQECLKHGVMTNGSFLPSLAHDAQSIEETLHALDAALGVVARAIKSGSVEGFLTIPHVRIFHKDGR